MPNAEFSGRTALVTGGSRGIGRAISLQLAAEGARVAVNYVSDEAAARETQARIEAAGGICRLFKSDVSDADQVEAMVREVERELQPVDLLVTSAAIHFVEAHAAMTYANWRRTMAVNLDGTFLPVMAVKDGMIQRRFGRIVCLSSIAALRPRPRVIAYSASKAAVIAFARSCAEAFAPDVRINCVAPGLIDTDMPSSIDEGVKQAMIRDTPLERIGRPEEISEMACFLLSERSSFTTGQTLVASGGRVTLP